MSHNLRITVINERLFRVEYSETGRFLDQPSFAFISRAAQREPLVCSVGPLPGTPSTGEDESTRGQTEPTRSMVTNILAESSYLQVAIEPNCGNVLVCSKRCRKTILEPVGSSTAALSMTYSYGNKYRVVKDEHNKGGALPTLDECDGWYHVRKQVDIRQREIGPGFYSTDGLAVIDESESPVFIGSDLEDPFDKDGFVSRAMALGDAPHVELILFEHSPDRPEQSFPELMRDYLFPYMGEPPKPPRSIFGVWFSRYWPYSQREIMELILRFECNRPSCAADASDRQLLPPVHLSVLVIDMDWHQPNQWTGFSWNRELFPDPEALLTWLHTRSHQIHVTLNLHPADGIAPNEDTFSEAQTLLASSHLTNETIPFHFRDAGFRKAYFGIVLSALENDSTYDNQSRKHGADFWWIDWQQGLSKLDGMDPMPLLNHFHYQWAKNRAREGRLLPVILSRWPGLGGHRYPVGFSGDTISSWNSLAMQPEFTAMAANVGYYYWSHDIGGHYGGDEDPELYLRWVQWGCFSPILRLHCSKNPFMSRTPWAFHSLEIESAVRHVLRLRSSLQFFLEAIPAHIPICAPMYHYPWRAASEAAFLPSETAYEWSAQYYFGDNKVIVAPFVAPREPSTQLSSLTVCLPTHCRWMVWDDGIAALHPCTDLELSELGGRTLWNRQIPSDVPLQRFGELRSLNVFLGEGAIIPRCVLARDDATLRITVVVGRTNRLEMPGLGLQVALRGQDGETVELERQTIERPPAWDHPNPITRLEIILRKIDSGTEIHVIPADNFWQQKHPTYRFSFAGSEGNNMSATESACACVKLLLHHFRLRSDLKEHLYTQYREIRGKTAPSADIRRSLSEVTPELTEAQTQALQVAHRYGMAAFAAPFLGDLVESKSNET
jgi:hypothetical protein